MFHDVFSMFNRQIKNQCISFNELVEVSATDFYEGSHLSRMSRLLLVFCTLLHLVVSLSLSGKIAPQTSVVA